MGRSQEPRSCQARAVGRSRLQEARSCQTRAVGHNSLQEGCQGRPSTIFFELHDFICLRLGRERPLRLVGPELIKA
jgi:hypothetical protein